MRLQLDHWQPTARLSHRLVWLDDGPLSCAICAQLGLEETCPAVRAVKAFAALHDDEWARAVHESRESLGVRVVDLTVDGADERVRVIFL
jgi:hypothetical protein